MKANNNTTDDIPLTEAELALVFEDCYTDIANKKVDGPYISAVIDGRRLWLQVRGYQGGCRAGVGSRGEDHQGRGMPQLRR